jgi:hypothetical protein
MYSYINDQKIFDHRFTFNSSKQLGKFINSGCDYVQHGTQIIKIHRIKRIKSYFCIAEIELMTLREFNLESLLSGRDRKIYRI